MRRRNQTGEDSAAALSTLLAHFSSGQAEESSSSSSESEGDDGSSQAQEARRAVARVPAIGNAASKRKRKSSSAAGTAKIPRAEMEQQSQGGTGNAEIDQLIRWSISNNKKSCFSVVKVSALAKWPHFEKQNKIFLLWLSHFKLLGVFLCAIKHAEMLRLCRCRHPTGCRELIIKPNKIANFPLFSTDIYDYVRNTIELFLFHYIALI